MTLFNPLEIAFFLVAASAAAFIYFRTCTIQKEARGLELREEAEERLRRFRPGHRTCEL
jgi:hypothetical protein